VPVTLKASSIEDASALEKKGDILGAVTKSEPLEGIQPMGFVLAL